MPIPSLCWRLLSPYDAYVVHVARLHRALQRLQVLAERALGYETGLVASVRLVPGPPDVAARRERLRRELAAATAMSDAELDDLIAALGGGEAAEVEQDRASVAARLGAVARALEEAFAEAADALATLERRRYDPRRRDVLRQLRANGLPTWTVEEFGARLRELGRLVGRRAAGIR